MKPTAVIEEKDGITEIIDDELAIKRAAKKQGLMVLPYVHDNFWDRHSVDFGIDQHAYYLLEDDHRMYNVKKLSRADIELLRKKKATMGIDHMRSGIAVKVYSKDAVEKARAIARDIRDITQNEIELVFMRD